MVFAINFYDAINFFNLAYRMFWYNEEDVKKIFRKDKNLLNTSRILNSLISIKRV